MDGGEPCILVGQHSALDTNGQATANFPASALDQDSNQGPEIWDVNVLSCLPLNEGTYNIVFKMAYFDI